MKFFEWNYEKDEVIEYRRIGKCNNCGQCCLAEISLIIASEMDESPGRNGGTGTTEKGIWSEVEDGDTRRFYQIDEINTQIENHRCPMLKNNRCTEYSEKANICTDWPMSPSQIASFPDCGYSFEEIENWEFDL